MALTVCLVALLLTYGVSTGIAMKKGGGPVPGPSRGAGAGPSRGASRGASAKAVPGPSRGASSGPVAGASGGASAGANSIIPLDMAPNSVDDMYEGCEVQMSKELPTYLENENNKNSIFKEGWADAEARANSNTKPIPGKEQKRALYYYTSGKDTKFQHLNAAVRTEGPQYKTTFSYHALHFLLTSAIKTLKADSNSGCVTVYRKTGSYFSQENVVNTQFRFGSFTSSSLNAYTNLKLFGGKSCFEIITCMGAQVSDYSRFPKQAEVLIPPYEIFKVTEILKSTPQKPLPCEWVYKVKSTETYCSNLNCALIPGSKPSHPCP